MDTISISKFDYDVLRAESSAYRKIIKSISVSFSNTPPTRSKSKVLEQFKKTKTYNKEFLASIKKGLARSSYFDQK